MALACSLLLSVLSRAKQLQLMSAFDHCQVLAQQWGEQKDSLLLLPLADSMRSCHRKYPAIA